jgi:hypothetical protein
MLGRKTPMSGTRGSLEGDDSRDGHVEACGVEEVADGELEIEDAEGPV